jgi:peptidoglycan/LPS O-acetylase OafA/YrhL
MTSTRPPLDRNLSTYLDLVRLGAALAVFTTHAHGFLLQSVDIAPWGREAVAVFFVLSGFVISYVAGSKEADWRAYATARAARILPVCVLAVLVTAIADAIGVAHAPTHYAYLQQQLHFYVPTSIAGAASYLSFTNQLWYGHAIFGTDEPYWSLGFEVQYYLVFGLLVFVRPLWAKLVLMLVWCAFVGPKILMYLPLWLMGVGALKLVVARYFRSIHAAILLNVAAIALAYAAYRYLGAYATTMYLSYDQTTELINFLYFNAVGLAVGLHLIGAAVFLERLPDLPETLGRPIQWLAGASFTIYLVHQPLLVVLSAFEVTPATASAGAALTAAALLICIVLAEFAERRKRGYAALFASLLRPARPAVSVGGGPDQPRRKA